MAVQTTTLEQDVENALKGVFRSYPYGLERYAENISKELRRLGVDRLNAKQRTAMGKIGQELSVIVLTEVCRTTAQTTSRLRS
ncbi:MAG: hypothetical protein KGH69_00060 [Candidatus Micrarchaeota archaeon]|nr:hypothetical protein [Candidatus Micrarchaeota archaeon]